MSHYDDGLFIADSITDELHRVVRQGLLDYNEPFLGPPDHRDLAVAIYREDSIAGGLIGKTARNFLHIDLLWVAQDWRGSGIGSRLMQAAEAESIARGCTNAVVDTADFQARPFYERHGYTVFGTLTGLRNGHETYYMVKRMRRE